VIRARLLLFLNRVFPPPIDYGGKDADAYSRWEFESGKGMFERHFASVVDMRGRRVLDVGCGTGGKAAFYATLDPAMLIALDVSERNVAQARAFGSAERLDARSLFVAAGAERLPFADASFDLVTATDTFEHFAKPLEVLREMARVLRPGGHVVFYFTPFRSPLGAHLYDVIHAPWCHLLVPERVLFSAMEKAYEKEERQRGTVDPAAAASRRAAEARRYYRDDLNRMTVSRFLRIVTEVPEIEVVFFKRKPLKTRLLSPLTRVPPFAELTTTLAIGLLRRRA
jgi:ubiquinone/menaquinone biosynthesis C-methylase UbiE